MLSFSLKNLEIIVSQRGEGSFRGKEVVDQYLEEKLPLLKDFQNFYLNLEHKDEVLNLDLDNSPKYMGDAFFKTLKKDVLSMVVGDCFPIIIFNQKTRKTAMIHGGWRSLYLNIAEKTIRKMGEGEKIEMKDLWVWIGPGIRKESYCFEQKPEQSKQESWKKHISQKNGKWQIDLASFIKASFLSLGIKEEQILDSQLDTYKEKEKLFSHKRAKDIRDEDGRFIVACYLRVC